MAAAQENALGFDAIKQEEVIKRYNIKFHHATFATVPQPPPPPPPQ